MYPARAKIAPLLALLAALALLVALPATAGATPPPQLYGRVTAIVNNTKTGTMRAFQLNHAGAGYTYRVTTNTQFQARSSAAAVEGFAQNDYAYVLARNGVAASVQFDTSPFKPGPAEHVIGMVTKTISKTVFVLKDSAAVFHKLYRNAATNYYVNGTPRNKPLVIKVGEALEVYAHKVSGHWLSSSINQETSSGG
ncbi:MAG TPA: hypothetical protein VG815_21335 [Chloroflexota bacterium]|jgi:hypothetical protein|nr:hypothetical protein [Chloroflexota bacterium]